MSDFPVSLTKILSSRRLVLFLALLAGITILSPDTDFQLWLSNGDHGLNLYGAEAVTRGEKPYRDFTWLYGPLMLYYYSFFMKVLGASITSVLLGKFILNLLCGVLIYQSLIKFIPPLTAMGGCVWFWLYNKGFFYTYNHAGGTLFLLILMHCLFTYILDPRRKTIYFGLAACFFLSLVKLNIGAFNLFGFMISIIVIDKFLPHALRKNNPAFYAGSLATTLGLIACSYGFFFFDSPVYVLKQSLQLFGNDVSYYYGISIADNIKHLLTLTLGDIAGAWQNLILTIIIFVSLLTIARTVSRGKAIPEPTKTFLAALAATTLFYILNLHEFVGSGIEFRRAWMEPAQLLTAFLIIGFGAQRFHRLFRPLLYGGLILFLTMLIYSELNVVRIFKATRPKLLLPKTEVYVVNGDQWTRVVTDTVSFLKTNLAPDEKFLALPYDPLYYFLMDRASPIRELALWKALGFIEPQEKRMIRDLEEKDVQWIVLSSRVLSDDPAFGKFGTDYCQLIGQYIKNRYKLVASFGDDTAPGGWIDHSIQILKKKPEYE